jgi:phosphatidylinositol glycan class A protein
MRRRQVLFVSDFFHPDVGGVETHMYHLAQNLRKRGHKVVVLTCMKTGLTNQDRKEDGNEDKDEWKSKGRRRKSGVRCGVRYLRDGLKVYYVPRVPLMGGTSLPTIFGTLRIFRVVALREQIDLVHSHQTSTLALECMWHAKTMNLETVYTCHSLNGFADIPSILLNKVLKLSCVHADAVICVSNVSKENMVLRASVPPRRVFVIPNAVHTSVFSPKRKLATLRRTRGKAGGTKTIVVVSRLVYRKGIDLLAQVLAAICRSDPEVKFMIVGDGPMRPLLEFVVQENQIQGQVKLFGNLPHERVIHILEEGNIFLNLSLTEAFGMAMLEAASVGLLVVSTSVGGVPEIFPQIKDNSVNSNLVDKVGMILCKPEANHILSAVEEALSYLPRTATQVEKQHKLVELAYNWQDIALRTERVYDFCEDHTAGNATILTSSSSSSMLFCDRLSRAFACGAFMGPLYCCVLIVHLLYYKCLQVIQPSVQVARDLRTDQLAT